MTVLSVVVVDSIVDLEAGKASSFHCEQLGEFGIGDGTQGSGSRRVKSSGTPTEGERWCQ